jgi:hypothetical protein
VSSSPAGLGTTGIGTAGSCATSTSMVRTRDGRSSPAASRSLATTPGTATGGTPREADYIATDTATPPHSCPAPRPAQARAAAPAAASAPAPAPTPAAAPASAPAPVAGTGTGPGGSWKSCTEARNAGSAPVLRGAPGYGRHLTGRHHHRLSRSRGGGVPAKDRAEHGQRPRVGRWTGYRDDVMPGIQPNPSLEDGRRRLIGASGPWVTCNEQEATVRRAGSFPGPARATSSSCAPRAHAPGRSTPSRRRRCRGSRPRTSS